jgi:hypothetical protein
LETGRFTTANQRERTAVAKKVSKPAIVQTPQEVLKDICAPHILPDESKDLYDDLRLSLLNDLAPKTAYQSLLAEQIVQLEWDVLRFRRLRDSLLRSEFVELAMGVFQEGKIEKICIDTPQNEAIEAARDLGSSDPERQQSALEKISETGIQPQEIMARAYQALAKDLEQLERQIAEAEPRRSKLREQYDRLQASSALAIDEAEEIEK